MARRTDRPFMTIAVDLGRKATKQTKQEISLKKIFGGSQILTINATKFAGFRRISLCMLESKTSGVVILFLSQF